MSHDPKKTNNADNIKSIVHGIDGWGSKQCQIIKYADDAHNIRSKNASAVLADQFSALAQEPNIDRTKFYSTAKEAFEKLRTEYQNTVYGTVLLPIIDNILNNWTPNYYVIAKVIKNSYVGSPVPHSNNNNNNNNNNDDNNNDYNDHDMSEPLLKNHPLE